jgi:hypothetical protein
LPQLTAEGIHLVRPEEMSSQQGRFLEEYFQKILYPKQEQQRPGLWGFKRTFMKSCKLSTSLHLFYWE